MTRPGSDVVEIYKNYLFVVFLYAHLLGGIKTYRVMPEERGFL